LSVVTTPLLRVRKNVIGLAQLLEFPCRLVDRQVGRIGMKRLATPPKRLTQRFCVGRGLNPQSLVVAHAKGWTADLRKSSLGREDSG